MGYGAANAHRVYYEKRYGSIPKGMEIDHLCGNRDCVNPDHLEAVTHAENVRRGRGTKLTVKAAREIHRLYEKGLTKTEIATRYGVTRGCVRHVLVGHTWRDVYESVKGAKR